MNKKPIKVYLQYPWKFPDSPYYKYLIDNPPEGIEYQNISKQKGVITNYRKFWILTYVKSKIRSIAKKIKLNMPNAHLSPEGDYDIIHCAHCLSKNKDKPWVADVESYWSLFVGDPNLKNNKEYVLNYLNQENCKMILPWTKDTRKEIIKNFPEIKDKVKTIYPAIPLKNIKKNVNKKVHILYATRHFWLKGGIIALEVLKDLKIKYSQKIEIMVIAELPEDIKMKYPTLKIHRLISQEEMKRKYSEADIFFYPSFMDTFGFGLIEAMSFGLPVITTETNYTRAVKEIISDGKEGFITKVSDDLTKEILREKQNLVVEMKGKEIIEEIVKKFSILIENKEFRRQMSHNCLEEIKNGKFSIKERNKKLKKIYEEALK